MDLESHVLETSEAPVSLELEVALKSNPILLNPLQREEGQRGNLQDMVRWPRSQ